MRVRVNLVVRDAANAALVVLRPLVIPPAVRLVPMVRRLAPVRAGALAAVPRPAIALPLARTAIALPLSAVALSAVTLPLAAIPLPLPSAVPVPAVPLAAVALRRSTAVPLLVLLLLLLAAVPMRRAVLAPAASAMVAALAAGVPAVPLLAVPAPLARGGPLDHTPALTRVIDLDALAAQLIPHAVGLREVARLPRDDAPRDD